MIPAEGFYCLKIGANAFFRYSVPKIFRCHVCESPKKYFEAKYPIFFARESGKRYSANGSFKMNEVYTSDICYIEDTLKISLYYYGDSYL